MIPRARGGDLTAGVVLVNRLRLPFSLRPARESRQVGSALLCSDSRLWSGHSERVYLSRVFSFSVIYRASSARFDDFCCGLAGRLEAGWAVRNPHPHCSGRRPHTWRCTRTETALSRSQLSAHEHIRHPYLDRVPPIEMPSCPALHLDSSRDQWVSSPHLQ